jgi:hypothetical protein
VSKRPGPRRVRTTILSIVTVVALVGSGVAIYLSLGDKAASCRVDLDQSSYKLELDQAQHATTIAAVGKRLGLADHAVTVALAAALQESKLYNLNYGDRDSLGVFQQRPSQGWGTPSQLMDPAYAAGAFYDHLARVPDWPHLPVSTAVQLVQHSADGSAYVQWEEEARSLARALTGEVEAGLTCRFGDPPQPRAGALSAAAAAQLGSQWQSRNLARGRDWATAEWLVAHAYTYGVIQVDVRGMRWTSSSGHWRAASSGSTAASYRLAPAKNS